MTRTHSGHRHVAVNDRRDQGILGVMLIAIGAIVAAGQLTEGSTDWVVLGVGLVPLATFFLTRWDWALIWGGIQTGAGVGVLLVSEPGADARGGLFLLALASGFVLVAALSSVYRLNEHRLWPLIPASILALVGLISLAGAPDVIGTIFRVGWPLALFVIGAVLVVRALMGSRSSRNDDTPDQEN